MKEKGIPPARSVSAWVDILMGKGSLKLWEDFDLAEKKRKSVNKTNESENVEAFLSRVCPDPSPPCMQC